MAFFDTLDKYELKQMGLDDDEIGTLEKALSQIPRPFRALIKNRIVDELKQAINDEGVDVVKDAIKSLKDALAADPGFVKNFKDMFKALNPAASTFVTFILMLRKKAANCNSDVCDLCKEQGHCSPNICGACPVAPPDPDYEDAMDNADPCTPAANRHMHENLPRRR